MKTILIVDDTKANIMTLIELLEDRYDILASRDGQNAIEIVKEDKPDLVLLDIMMPDMDGFEVCEILKSDENTKDIPVIFLTAKTEEESIEKAYEIGGIDYITKPFKQKELLAKIKREIQLKELKRKEIEYQRQSSIKEFLHNITHQWRQPLSTMSTSAGHIELSLELEDNVSNDELYQHCRLIKEETESLSNTLQKLESIVSNNGMEKHNLKNIIDMFLVQNKVNLQQAGINKHLEIYDDIYLMGHFNQFVELFSILLQNSIDAFEKIKNNNRYIYIEASKEENKVIIEFKDNAGGIDNNIIDKVFEPYITTKHKAKGVGLSLNHVFNLITHMKGSIDVQNNEFFEGSKKYQGACVKIILNTL